MRPWEHTKWQKYMHGRGMLIKRSIGLTLRTSIATPGWAEIKISVPLKTMQHDPRYRAMLEKLKLPV